MNALLAAAATHGPTVLAVDPAKVKPGWLAFVILSLIGLATYLLWRSMNRQLKKVDFDDGVDRSKDRSGREERSQPVDSSDESEQSEQSEQSKQSKSSASRSDGSIPDSNGGTSASS